MRRVQPGHRAPGPPPVGCRPAGWMVGGAGEPADDGHLAMPVQSAREPERADACDRGLRGRHLDPHVRRGLDQRPAGSAAVARPQPGAGALPDGHDHHRGQEGRGHHPAPVLPAGRQRVVGLRMVLHDRGDPDRRRHDPLPGREIRGLRRLLRPGIASGCDGAGVRRRRGGEGGDRIDRPHHGRGLDRVRASADRAHHAGHSRLPGHGKRPATGPDHGLRRNHGNLGPALRRRPRRALPRRHLRQRRHRRDAGPAGAAQHRRDGQPDQRPHRRPRPRPAGTSSAGPWAA